MTPSEDAEGFGVTRRTVTNTVADGRPPAYRLGPRRTRLRLDELQAARRPTRMAV
ncbi:excisionase family DNA-binding protein [Nocardia sp. CA-107356]|uniref:excisionase family DNA-binding protein n=1 Tax=Nocardia sp. CA-107356 TaxID=3239972 RepID=UPI003D8A16DF